MGSRILANLGFLLQITGILTILPIGVGLYFNEIDYVISLFIVCIAYLGLGFLCNAMCERKDLDFKSSNTLFLAAFIILPLIGTLPFIYNDPFNSANLFDRFTNGYFESISGFTTTGFSFLSTDLLPKSLLIYRSLTELMGGVGLVFLLLAFFQSRKAMSGFSNALGVDTLSKNLKQVFFSVLAIYGVYIIAFTIIFQSIGFTDIIKTGTFVIDTLTGGFAPSAQQFQQYLSFGSAAKICMIILMFLGSVNFAFNYNLFARKLKKVLSAEIALYLLIIAVGTVAVALTAQIGAFDSLFHVVSMSSSTGYDYIGLTSASFNNTAFFIFIMLMLIGGCAFSMAGGIRVSRLITFARSIKHSIEDVLIKEKVMSEPEAPEEANNHEYLPALVSILLFVFTLVIFALLFTTMGVSFTDALFEVGSALSTNGISMGATTISMPIGYKWLMIVAMTIGRVELMSILVALFPYRPKAKAPESIAQQVTSSDDDST